MALKFQNIIAPDEVFQALEQAHRLVFGQGVVPWEFQVGLRCWLIPLLLAGPMALVHLIDPEPLAGLVVIRLLLCLASLGIVFCAARWGERFYGVKGLWIAGVLAALWPDLWLMAPHPLEEVLAADVLVPAVYLISTAHSCRRVAWAGLLLGLAFTLRMQLAPAIAIAGIALCQRDYRRWAVALAAAFLPVLAAGMLDWFTWGQPFRSFWLNIYLNVFLGVAAQEFGSSSVFYYAFMLALDWFWALPVVLFLAWAGARRLPLAGVMALVIVATHTLIAHKEFRFIFPAIALAVPLAGVGLAGVFLTRWRTALGMLLLAGPLASPWIYFMLSWQENSVRLFETLALSRPELVSLQGWDNNFRSYLPFDIAFPSGTRLTRQTITASPGGMIEADAIVGTLPGAKIPEDFERQACYRGTWIPFATAANPEICIWRRPGPVRPGATPPFSLPFPAAAKPFVIAGRLVR